MKRTEGRQELHLGGQTLIRRVGGVDIEDRNGGPSVRIQDADLDDVIRWLKKVRRT